MQMQPKMSSGGLGAPGSHARIVNWVGTINMAFMDVQAAVDAECRRAQIPMLGPQKMARLVELLRQARPEVVVEVGTAIGYSGLWIAETLRTLGRGRLLTFEQDPDRAEAARKNFEAAGLAPLITQYIGDARERLKEVTETVDFLFLDGGFANYYPCFRACQARLRDGALLVADNAGIGAAEMADYLAQVRAHYESRTAWFETDLSWNPKDAMEISVYREV